MIIDLEKQRKLHAKAEKARKRTIRRYLREVSTALPCRFLQKRKILTDLREMAFGYPQKLSTRSELEEALGTPDELARIYIGENAVPTLRKTKLRRAATLFILLLLTGVFLGVYLSRPMVYYTETIEVLNTPTETVTIQNPGSAEPLHTAMPRAGTKTVTCFDRNGTKLWSVTVTGTFGYVHGYTGQVLDAEDTLISHTEKDLFLRRKNYLTTNTAVTEVTMQYNGVTVLKKVSLTCDRFGKLS